MSRLGDLIEETHWNFIRVVGMCRNWVDEKRELVKNKEQLVWENQYLENRIANIQILCIKIQNVYNTLKDQASQLAKEYKKKEEENKKLKAENKALKKRIKELEAENDELHL